MDTASSGTAIRSFYSLPPLMASLPLWLICQEMMLMLLKRSVFF
ncbi:putative PilO conjugative transfer domain protein [Escherichia coli EC4402]|nr:putative PilO conjugative transfer domain protein [Escherichia coli EC4402]